jgi:hypothetical protein
MLDSKRNIVIAVVVAAVVAIAAYLYVSQPATVGVAPEPAPTQQAK